MSDESVLGPDPLRTARELQQALEGMTKQLAAVKATVRRSRRVIVALCVSLALDVCLTIGVAVATIQSSDASSRASSTVTQLHSSNISACRQANVSRGEDIAIWDRLLKVPAGVPAAARAEVADLERLVGVKDKPRDCNALYRIP